MSVKWRIVWQALYQFERREILRHEAEQRLLSAGLTIGEVNERINEVLIYGHYTMRREEPALSLQPLVRKPNVTVATNGSKESTHSSSPL